MIRLLSAGSVEEHIAGVAEEKRRFADSSITGERFFHSHYRIASFIYTNCVCILLYEIAVSGLCVALVRSVQ